MVLRAVSGRGMDQHIQSIAIQHQPGNHFAKLIGRKSDLIHGLQMRADEFVMPPPELYIKLSQSFAHPRSRLLRSWIIVDMRVITFNLGRRLSHSFTSEFIPRILAKFLLTTAQVPEHELPNACRRTV